MLSVQVFGPGGHYRNTAPEYFGSMGVQRAAAKAPQRKRPWLFPSDRPSKDSPYRSGRSPQVQEPGGSDGATEAEEDWGAEDMTKERALTAEEQSLRPLVIDS